MSKNLKFEIPVLVVLFMMGASGCDAVNAIKEYFQEPEKKAAAVPPAPAAMPEQAKPQPAAATEMTPNTLARVGSWTITVEEFNERLAALKEVVPDFNVNDPESKSMILDELVNQQVLVLGAEQSGLARQKDIVAAVDEFRRTLIVREVARELTGNITVTEDEARAFFDQNKESMVGPEGWHVREIVAPTKAQATSILAEVLGGADFAETARTKSTGKSATNGGDLGFITQEPFPQMGEALVSLAAGAVSDVFEGPEGFYIVKLEEKRPGAPLVYEDIKDDIIQSQTLLKQQQVILDHLNDLKKKIPVEVNAQLLQ